PRPSPILHAGDYAAWYKHATGDWIYDFAGGQITSRRTGRLVPFRVTPDGYLEASVIIKGIRIHIRKHRAIWIAAHGILALPIDYALEIDHINHNRTDCRLENLRLVRPEVNRRNRPGLLSDDTVRTIRRRYREEIISMAELAREFGLCRKTISRIIHHKTYRSIPDE
ncbi:HNH endonuclease, partial [Methanocorpusculum sp. MG]